MKSPVSTLRLVLLGSGLVSIHARRMHDSHREKHAHTYLYLCADDSTVTGNVCIHRVPNKWPHAAVLSKSECKEATRPHQAIGTSDSSCSLTSPVNKNLFKPITIPMGITSPPGDYRRGADVDTFTDWDRIRCRDGQMFATGWYLKYTPHECARLCSKINDFYGKTCTHFSRQWVNTDIAEHDDACGRDGDSGLPPSAVKYGAYDSAGVGGGSYKHRGQCIFFSSKNDECCSTRAAWREAGSDTDDNYCQSKYGDRHDNWNSKHRSWRRDSASTFTPSKVWPVTSRGRRLSATPPAGLDGEQPHVHELIFANGTTVWAVEDDSVEGNPFNS